MLAKTYEFHVDNGGDASVTMTFTVTPWKFNTTTGALEYGTPFTRTAAMAAGNNGIIGATVDNSSDLFLGAHIEVSFAGGGTGTLTAYLMITGADVLTMALASVTDPAAGTLVVGAEI